MTTEKEKELAKELCDQKHIAVDRRVDSIENKIWIVIGASFVQLLAIIGYLFDTFVVKKGG